MMKTGITRYAELHTKQTCLLLVGFMTMHCTAPGSRSSLNPSRSLARAGEMISGDMPYRWTSMGYVTPPSVPTKILSELGGRQAVVIVFGLERKGRWRESEQRMKNIREERERERERGRELGLSLIHI